MGCGSSKITVVKAVEPSSLVDGNEKNAFENDVSEECPRGESAVSKQTTDSGLGLEAGEVAAPRKLSPLRGSGSMFSKEDTERLKTQEILEQLQRQGIIPAHPRHGETGEAYSIMLDSPERPLRRPPLHLESLKTRVGKPFTKEDIETRMRTVEERRKAQEEALKRKLRNKSARRHETGGPKEDNHVELDADPTTVSRQSSPEPQREKCLILGSQQITQFSCTTKDKDDRVWDDDGNDVGLGEVLVPPVESDATFQTCATNNEYF